MLKEIKEKYPSWCSKEYMESNDISLCLTDDIDSLASCVILNELFNTPIEWFYRFDSIGRLQNTNTSKKCIGIDMDICNGKVWGNHITRLSNKDSYNPNCANINLANDITRSSYYNKFAGSTLIQVLGYYSIDIEHMTDEQKLVIVSIDSFFIPFKVQKIDFRPQQRKYLKQLEQEHLEEFIQYYIDKNGYTDFYNIMNKYKLTSKIDVKDGILTTDIDLNGLSKLFNMPFVLPKNKFNLSNQFRNLGLGIKDKNITSKKDIAEDIFSFAITNKDFVKYSILKK